MHAKENLIRDGKTSVQTSKYFADLEHNGEETDVLRNNAKNTAIPQQVSEDETVIPRLSAIGRLLYQSDGTTSNSNSVRTSKDLAGQVDRNNITDTTDKGDDNDGVRRGTPWPNGKTSSVRLIKTVFDNVSISRDGEGATGQVAVREKRSENCPESPAGEVSTVDSKMEVKIWMLYNAHRST